MTTLLALLRVPGAAEVVDCELCDGTGLTLLGAAARHRTFRCRRCDGRGATIRRAS